MPISLIDKHKNRYSGVMPYLLAFLFNLRPTNPEEIIADIEKGIKKTKGKYECITDRREAMKKAISMANKKDIVIFAGKGHETYQEISKEKNPFDERIITKEILEELQNEPKKRRKNKN